MAWSRHAGSWGRSVIAGRGLGFHSEFAEFSLTPALCDWMGFPIPTRENTIRPVRQSLENQFFGVYQAVRAQLLRTRGVPGLSDDDLNPIAWEHEAVESQRELYGEQGEAAWEKSYEGILPDRFSRP